jgi:hypothetical protein
MGRLEDAVAMIGEFVDTFDADLVGGERAARLVEVFTQGARFCEAGRLAAAARVEHTHAWKADGHRNAREWYQAKTKTSASAATTALETAGRLAHQPRLNTSLRSGKISADQANEIASAAHADPTAEHDLVAEAERHSLKRTRKSCQAVRAAAAKDPVGDRQKIHASRYFAHWTTSDGAFEGKFRVTADHGAIVCAALEQERRAVFAQARADGTREPHQAYLADAFVNLARNTLSDPAPTPDPTRPEATDSEATDTEATGHLHRSRPNGGDPNRSDHDGHHAVNIGLGDGGPDDGDPDAPGVPGESDPRPDPDGGPPGGVSRDSGGHPTTPTPSWSGVQRPDHRCPTCHRRPGPTRPPAVINVRVDHAALVRGHTNPGDVCEIEGIGPVPVETVRAAASDAILNALLIRDGHVVATTPAGRTIPAHLRRTLTERDRTCVIPGCDNQRHLEIHHLKPFAEGGTTTEDNTARICPHHHDQITYADAILTGPPGHWRWTPPPTTPHPPTGTPDLGGTKTGGHRALSEDEQLAF